MSRNPVWDYLINPIQTPVKHSTYIDCGHCFHSVAIIQKSKLFTGWMSSRKMPQRYLNITLYMRKVEFRQQGPPAKKAKLSAAPKTIKLGIQQTITWPDDHPAVRRIDKATMDLMIVDMLPHSVGLVPHSVAKVMPSSGLTLLTQLELVILSLSQRSIFERCQCRLRTTRCRLSVCNDIGCEVTFVFVIVSFSAVNGISFSSAFSFTAENEKCISVGLYWQVTSSVT